MALAGPWLVGVLYDVRYAQAGAMVTLLALALAPQVIGLTYDQAALAAGDSRRFFIVTATRAVLQISFLVVGVIGFGLIGALVGMGLAQLLTHAAVVWLARVHEVWDLRHDVLTGGIAALVALLALWLHQDVLLTLAAG